LPARVQLTLCHGIWERDLAWPKTDLCELDLISCLVQGLACCLWERHSWKTRLSTVRLSHL